VFGYSALPVPKLSFILTTYDPERPGVIVATGRDSVELDDPSEFWSWVDETYPAPRYGVRVTQQ
jgi:hypothetical protein